jgi:hypothetical protein
MLDHNWLIGRSVQEPWALVSEPYDHITPETIEQNAPLFGIPHHGGADAALHRIRRIAAFDLGDDAGLCAVGNAIEAHERSASDAE